MNYEKWQNIVDNTKDKFEITDEGETQLNENDSIEYLEFQLGDKDIRLELLIKPKLLEKKTIYSNRSNAETTEQFIFDPEEKTYTFTAFNKNEQTGEWDEISGDTFE